MISQTSRESIIEELEKMFSEGLNIVPEKTEEWLNNFLKYLTLFYNGDRAYIFLISDDFKYLANTNRYCAPNTEMFSKSLENFPINFFPYFGSLISKNKPVIIPKVVNMPKEAELEKKTLTRYGVKSLIMFPLLCCNRATGFVGIDMIKIECQWTESDIELLSAASEIVSNILERKVTYLQLQKCSDKVLENAKRIINS